MKGLPQTLVADWDRSNVLDEGVFSMFRTMSALSIVRLRKTIDQCKKMYNTNSKYEYNH